MDNIETSLSLDQFSNPYSLNIFSDASMRKSNDGTMSGCYGVVAVCQDKVIDEFYRFVSESTVNGSEIRGVRGSLILANKFRQYYKYINIFCDSQISIVGLREYIFGWRYDPKTNLLYNTVGKPVANQSVFVESLNMLENLKLTNIVNLYHQSGHVKNGYKELCAACDVFKRTNKIPKNCKVDLNLIRYISTYNNYVDSNSRSKLYIANIYDNYWCDPISFSWKRGG